MAKRKTKSKKAASRKTARKSAPKTVKSAARKTAKKGSARKTAALVGGGLATLVAGALARTAVRSLAKSGKKPAASAAQKGKWVYSFGGGRAEGKPDQRNLLGGKGAGLAEMANLGLPVPPGFTITTEVCTYYYAHEKQYPKELEAQVAKALAEVGRITGKVFGDRNNPLLVSVRSGARASMPGMMDTVLNLGLNDETVEALAKKSGDKRFAYDSYRRFITMYSDVVLGVGHEHFEELLDHHKER
ncbi:MAG TPA: PEP/pyruvate-binding domain-containing protein, partial [Pseudolabrys sp.]|nr:PEP/pyruvate-binding domain-containing protein [Pseudolabrys sp.]